MATEIDPFYRRLGESIRERRKAKKRTQEDLAVHMGLTRTSIVNIEKGRQHVAVHQLVRVSDFLGCSPADLFPSREEETLLSNTSLRDTTIDRRAFSFVSEVSAEAGRDR